MRIALARCRTLGLNSPFTAWQAGGRNPGQEQSVIGIGLSPERLAAALLIPIDEALLAQLLEDTYLELQTTQITT